MTDELQQGLLQLVGLVVYGAAGAWAATLWARRMRGREAPRAAGASKERPPAPLRAEPEVFERCRVAEEAVGTLRHALLQIPEIAQRLFAAKGLREVPDLALDLVEEMFAPAYALFYGLKRGDFVLAARRGNSEFALGHRLQKSQGVVGWTALRQIAFTPEDAAHESRSVRERDLAFATPRDGFTVCLPIVSGEDTIGVMLVGPTQRAIDMPKELGHTIALLTSVAITSLQLLQREQHLAKTDGLTGLLNKRTILEQLSERLRSGGKRPLSVFMFDIDHFKKYNDSNGHLAGDDLLRGMGDLIREHSRDGEGLGRYGGEEFVLVMDGASKPEALATADRLRELVASAHFPHRERQPAGMLTISGGVATWPGDGDDVAALLGCADAALYQAKRAGRNRVLAHHRAELVTPADDEELDETKGGPSA